MTENKRLQSFSLENTLNLQDEPDPTKSPLAMYVAEKGYPPPRRENRPGRIKGATIVYLPGNTGVLATYREGHFQIEDEQNLSPDLQLRGDNLPVHGGEQVTGLDGGPETVNYIKGASNELPLISELGGVVPQVLAGQDAASLLEHIQHNTSVTVHDLKAWRASLLRDTYQYPQPQMISREGKMPVKLQPTGSLYDAAAAGK